jgi:3',5'-cyclic-AMP phosphodiesterase
MEKRLHLWLTDTHVRIWARYRFLNAILDEAPYAVLHTGDITEGPFLTGLLDFLGNRIGRPFYFNLGNHDIWGSSLAQTHADVRELCKRHRNLIWLNDAGVVRLNEDSCLLGSDGWYDCNVGNTDYIRYTLDWLLIKEFRDLPTMEDRIAAFRQLAKESADDLSNKLEEAFETYDTCYLLTHVPPFAECHRSTNPWFEKFWAPYNSNITLGNTISKIMNTHRTKRLVILCGHNHMATTVMSGNIECRVGSASYAHIHDRDIRHLYI